MIKDLYIYIYKLYLQRYELNCFLADDIIVNLQLCPSVPPLRSRPPLQYRHSFSSPCFQCVSNDFNKTLKPISPSGLFVIVRASNPSNLRSYNKDMMFVMIMLSIFIQSKARTCEKCWEFVDDPNNVFGLAGKYFYVFR